MNKEKKHNASRPNHASTTFTLNIKKGSVNSSHLVGPCILFRLPEDSNTISWCGGEIVSAAVNAVLHQIHLARPQESENSTARLSKCKMLHSIQYSHWDSNTDRADSKTIETNGRTALDCVSILMAGCYIFGPSLRPCVQVPVRACETFGEGRIAAYLLHIIGQLSIIHRNKSTTPPSTCSESYNTRFCPLLSLRKTHCNAPTHWVVFKSACRWCSLRSTKGVMELWVGKLDAPRCLGKMFKRALILLKQNSQQKTPF